MEKQFRDAVMVRTYCRAIESQNRRESPEEVFQRVLAAFEEYYLPKNPWLIGFYERDNWLKMMRDGVALPAGRMLWAMGSRTIKEEGFLPLMNCSFVKIDHPVDPVLFAMKMLILGCGVGFSLEKKHMDQTRERFSELKKPGGRLREAGTDFTSKLGVVYMVQDSREGWIAFIEKVIYGAIRGINLEFSLARLRPAGSPIKGFGGVSGDPRKLSQAAFKIWNAITHSDEATVSLYYDIMCWIAELIVSGNVRRSALIAIGDPWDTEFLELKQFEYINRWKATQRYFCNNSVNIRDWDDLGEEYWATYDAGKGEPYGWVSTSRAAELQCDLRFPPEGYNPCGEQPLASKEVCCLGEVNIEKIQDFQQFKTALTMVYLFCKLAYTLGAPTEPETDTVCQHNQRIGISLTGLAMVPREKITGMVSQGQLFVNYLDREVSKQLCVNRSVALTTVKPGGTLPKIAGSSGPGVHLPISEYQIRRVRFSIRCSLIPWLARQGIPIERDRASPLDTMVASFYLRNSEPDCKHYADWQLEEEGFRWMLQRVVDAQNYWSENSVSVTLYYNPEWSVEKLQKIISEYQDQLKCLSCLPYYGHNFDQAPEQPISAEEYESVASNMTESVPVPLALDGIEIPEDFGSCMSGGGCSDR